MQFSQGNRIEIQMIGWGARKGSRGFSANTRHLCPPKVRIVRFLDRKISGSAGERVAGTPLSADFDLEFALNPIRGLDRYCREISRATLWLAATWLNCI